MKHKFLTAAAAMPLSLMLTWGAMQSMISGLNLPVDDPGRLFVLWTAVALAGSLLFSFKTGSLLVLSGVLAAIYWLWNHWGISIPIRAFITRLSIIYNGAYHWGVLEFAGMDWRTTSLDFLFFVWGGIIVLTAAASVVRGRGGIAAIALAGLPLGLTLVVTDTTPDALPLFCLVLAGALLMLTRSVAHQDPAQGARLAALAAIPTAAVLGSLFLLCPKDDYVNKAPERLEAITDWWEDTFVAPFRRGGLGQDLKPTPTASASTRLSSLGPRRVVPYKVMEVTADFNGTLYLRGQDYDVYDGMSWTSTLDRTEVLEKGPHSCHRGSVTVKTLRPMDLVYLPSYPSRDYALNDGRLENTNDETEFSWSVSQVTLRNVVTFQNYPAEYEAYLSLPESTREWAKLLVDEILENRNIPQGYDILLSGSQVTGSAAQAIVDHVGNSARYSLNTGRMDSGYDDFAQWFLMESDTGYCVHFATAAAVLLRAAGIPARYVTGYMVSCEAGQTVTVESDRAHAWVEYYDADARAWVIAEPTPPDLSEDEPETESVTAPPPVTEAPTGSESETTAPTRPTQPNATRPTDGSKPAAPQENHFRLWKILRWPVLAAALWLAAEFQRLLRIFLRRRSMAGGPNSRALGLWRDVERLSAVLGQSPPPELLELAQKARFSQHKLTRDELRRFTLWLREARGELEKHPLPRRLWCRYVLARW